jgi:hypothetical protein
VAPLVRRHPWASRQADLDVGSTEVPEVEADAGHHERRARKDDAGQFHDQGLNSYGSSGTRR